MSFYSPELDKSFENKSQLIKALKENKKDIIGIKKSQIQKSCEKGVAVGVQKELKVLTSNKELQLDDDFYYIAVNTTKILDSHKDLHVSGIWNKTVKDQQGKNYLVMDHVLSMSSVIVKKEDIEMIVSDVPFSSVGKSYLGMTQALIYKFRKDSVINPMAKEWLESGDDIEASVRMQYVDILLAINSTDPDDEEEYKVFLNYIDQIANKGDFEEISYFWVVKEAKNVAESSLVLQGSNSATGVIEQKVEPSQDTQKHESLQNTHEKGLNYEFISSNFKL